MNSRLSVPPATRDKLARPAAPGFRHQQIRDIVVPLVAQGFNAEAIFQRLRPNYAEDLPDSEIRDLIDWAENRSDNFRRSTWSALPKGARANLRNRRLERGAELNASDERFSPIVAVERFIGDTQCEDVDLWEQSPVRLQESFKDDPWQVFFFLFEPHENINVVSEFRQTKSKACPIGYGETATREEWLSRCSSGDVPHSKAGTWIRPNPMDGKGIADDNVAKFRFLLVEFDIVPLPLQLPFLARLRLPISAVISSGGKSLHAWVRIDGNDAADFRAKAKWIFDALAPFGLDTANRNPSRLSRLPGVFREIGGVGDNRQRLLYLNRRPTIREIIA